MKLFRSIFMAVIVIVPGLARGADYTVVGNIVRYTGMISDWDFVNADLNTGGRKAFDNHLTEKFCMTTAGNNVTVDQAGIVIPTVYWKNIITPCVVANVLMVGAHTAAAVELVTDAFVKESSSPNLSQNMMQKN